MGLTEQPSSARDAPAATAAMAPAASRHDSPAVVSSNSSPTPPSRWSRMVAPRCRRSRPSSPRTRSLQSSSTPDDPRRRLTRPARRHPQRQPRPDLRVSLSACCQDRQPGLSLLVLNAGWSSPVARRAHNPKVAGSNPAPATNVMSRDIGNRRTPIRVRLVSLFGVRMVVVGRRSRVRCRGSGGPGRV